MDAAVVLASVEVVEEGESSYRAAVARGETLGVEEEHIVSSPPPPRHAAARADTLEYLEVVF